MGLVDIRVDTIGTDISTQWDRLIREFPAEADRIVRRVLRPYISRRIDQSLRKPPPKRVYNAPVRWKSERQKRAFFATEGFGRGIPTQRTNGYVTAWHVRADYKNNLGIVRIYNDVIHEAVSSGERFYPEQPYAAFVGGIWQQPFHTDTGWPNAARIIPVILQEAQALAIDEVNNFFNTMGQNA